MAEYLLHDPRALFDGTGRCAVGGHFADRGHRQEAAAGILGLIDIDVAEASPINAGNAVALDQARLDQYYSAVRDLERQLELAQEWECKPKPTTTAPAPTDISENKKLIDKIRLMLDVARLGFKSDSTRVVSLFINTFSVVCPQPGHGQSGA